MMSACWVLGICLVVLSLTCWFVYQKWYAECRDVDLWFEAYLEAERERKRQTEFAVLYFDRWQTVSSELEELRNGLQQLVEQRSGFESRGE